MRASSVSIEVLFLLLLIVALAAGRHGTMKASGLLLNTSDFGTQGTRYACQCGYNKSEKQCIYPCPFRGSGRMVHRQIQKQQPMASAQNGRLRKTGTQSKPHRQTKVETRTLLKCLCDGLSVACDNPCVYPELADHEPAKPPKAQESNNGKVKNKVENLTKAMQTRLIDQPEQRDCGSTTCAGPDYCPCGWNGKACVYPCPSNIVTSPPQ